jgi:hypothetical protein
MQSFSFEVPDPPLVSVFSAPYAVKRGALYAYLEAPDAEVAMLVRSCIGEFSAPFLPYVRRSRPAGRPSLRSSHSANATT